LLKLVSTAILALIALAPHAIAQETGNARKGAVVAQSVCAQCHAVRAGEKRSPDPMAPSFASVAMWPGMSVMALDVWLQSSHPTMPNFKLTRSDRDDVVAYIMSLKAEASAR
jgi:mono/diheme cytochrome c family protein